MLNKLRHLLWRILGVNYQMILKKLDYTLLKHDQFTTKGVGTYDNGAKVWRWTKTPLTIGRYCSIAHGVNFIVDEGFHSCSAITNYPFINNLSSITELVEKRKELQQREGIHIGNDVWIGMNAIILPGVKIGNGANIAAGAVVTKDIPNYALVAGVPAKIVRMKHSEDNIQKLNKIAWWNWSKEELSKRKLDFYNLSMEEFIKKYH